MKNLTRTLAGAFIVLASSTAVMGAAQADTRHDGDPARWYVADTTPQMHYNTSVKEANAAYQEAVRECRHSGGGKAHCMQSAEHERNAALTHARIALHAAEGHMHRDVAGR